MKRSVSNLITAILAATYLVPVIAGICGWIADGVSFHVFFVIENAVLLLGVAAAAFLSHLLVRSLEPAAERAAREQAAFLDSIPPRYINLAIFGAAALSLCLELSLIRWQSSAFEFFAFYKNFGLLSCFAGLGLGYALASRPCIPLVLTIPALAWQIGFLIMLRFAAAPETLAPLQRVPFREQLSMGLFTGGTADATATFFLLSVVFLQTALAFIPVGQVCGRVMQRRPKLSAYGLNLLGSLCGVLVTFALGFLWTPPLVWWALCFLALLLFYPRTVPSLLTGSAAIILTLVILAWPVDTSWKRIYSPYQLLEVGYSPPGLMLIRASGQYFQQVHNLSEHVPRYAVFVDRYYRLPYAIHGDAKEVAVVGAGTGNDVAAALRSGAARVDAIEIDPAILAAGRANHPERPYSDPRVHAIVTDARSFLRQTQSRYDLIVYGLLDSHSLLSHASSVRLDSFVYTVEALREARARLKPNGVMSISFAVMNEALGTKIYRMLQEVFDGRPPLALAGIYDGSVVYLQNKEGNIRVARSWLAEQDFHVVGPLFARSSSRVDASTDDWPFLYMPRRIYPVSYAAFLSLLALLTVTLVAFFFDGRPRLEHLPAFCLGAGFMLIETKAITEMGLTFGNTWHLIGISIAGILVMAFLANWSVQRSAMARHSGIFYMLLLLSLAAGWLISRAGGFPPTSTGRLATVLVLTCPVFFSGIAFSSLLTSRGDIAGLMAANLLGALLGGMLEYNSMYFGFRFLYLLAGLLYALAFVTSFLARRARSARASAAETAEAASHS